MTIANHFYNGTTRRYIALFGSLFNKMSITRSDNTGTPIQSLVVPIAYGPYQKFLAKITQDPNLNRGSAITLPRMSFEITSMSYDASRKIGSLNKSVSGGSGGTQTFMYAPTPYNLEFSLYIMTKYAEDGTQILEQILPFFKPDYTFSARIIDNQPAVDLPLVLNSVSVEDIYDGDFETRRSLMWTLSFTFKCVFFGPERQGKVIKFAKANVHTSMETDSYVSEEIIERPGLTTEGLPTTDVNESVPYQDIDFDDDWDFISIINSLEEISNE